jgi:hypothetical protein
MPHTLLDLSEKDALSLGPFRPIRSRRISHNPIYLSEEIN